MENYPFWIGKSTKEEKRTERKKNKKKNKNQTREALIGYTVAMSFTKGIMYASYVFIFKIKIAVCYFI